jgi:anti-anti-sigma regulatory factor
MYSDLHISFLQVFCIVLDMMSVCFVDPSAIKTLIAMYKEFKSRGLLFCLADCSGKR